MMDRVIIGYLIVLTVVGIAKSEELVCEKDAEAYKDDYVGENLFTPTDDSNMPCAANLVSRKPHTAIPPGSSTPATASPSGSSTPATASPSGSSTSATASSPGSATESPAGSSTLASASPPSSSTPASASPPGSSTPSSASPPGSSTPAAVNSPGPSTVSSPKTYTLPSFHVFSATIIVTSISIVILIVMIVILLTRRPNTLKTTLDAKENSLNETVSNPREGQLSIASAESTLGERAINEGDGESDQWSVGTAYSSSPIFVSTSLEMESMEL